MSFVVRQAFKDAAEKAGYQNPLENVLEILELEHKFAFLTKDEGVYAVGEFYKATVDFRADFAGTAKCVTTDRAEAMEALHRIRRLG